MKRIASILTLILVLVFHAQAQGLGGLDIGEAMQNISNPQNWYYVNLTAKNSTTTGGSGEVKLMTIAPDSTRIYDSFMGQSIDAQMQYCLWPYGNPQGFAAEVTQIGFSLIYMPGVELNSGGMALSTYAYFAGWAKANDGSYFDGWSYADGGTDLGYGGAELDYEEGVKDNYAVFQILPDNNPGYTQDPTTYIITGKTNRTVYATFRPVQIKDFRVNLGEVEAESGNTTTVEVYATAIGKNIDTEDFYEPVVAGEDWALDEWYYDEEEGEFWVGVVYTAPEGIEAGNEYRTTVTIATKGGSEVVVPVAVRAVEADREDASLKIGESEQSGDWASMLALANTASAEPVVLTLNKDVLVEQTQEISHTMTLNLNGYTLSSSDAIPLRINAGVVTLAYSKYNGNIVANEVAVEVAGGELILEGGNVVGQPAVDVLAGAKLTLNGAVLDGMLRNAGTTIIKDGTLNGQDYAIRSTGDLTIEGGILSATTGVYVEDGTAHLKKGHIEGYEVAVLNEGNTTIEKLAELASEEGTALLVSDGTVTVNCVKLDAPTLIEVGDGTLTLVSAYIKDTIGVVIPTGKQLWRVTAGPEYREGYVWFVGDAAAARAAGVPVCTIGTVGYASLEDALAYANNNKQKEVMIVMQNDYTLPAGYFTLPANAKLLIPYEDGQERDYSLLTRIAKNSQLHVDYILPYEYRRLTLANGAHLDVFGQIEVSGRQFASDEAYAAVPYGAYGHVVMAEGSSMTLQNGALLRVWGYITGTGEIDVRRGATVREQFQMGDWKGGTTSMNMLTDWRHVFPLTQYYIQSIESPVKYHAGAVLSTATAVSAALGGMPLVATANDIKIVGVDGQDEAMFLMSTAADEENTWVRKWYDVENDIQTYEVYSSAHIGSMVLDLGKIGGQDMQMHSGQFNLPITNNMKIHLLYGYMDFTQNTELLPGAEVEIDKESTVAIVHNNNASVVSGSLYIYSADDWDAYAYDGSGNTRTKAVKYSPSWGGKPTARNLNVVEDAKINVHGTFETWDGYVLTSEHGANIFSSNEDAGTFLFTTAALTPGYTEDVYQVKGRSNYEYKVFYPAQLKNAEGATPAYATTAGTEAGKSYCYLNDRWTLMTVAADFNFMQDNYGDYYAKPGAYVPVVVSDSTNYGTDAEPYWAYTGNADHTFSGKYEQDRLFILMDNGQWWEVSIQDNLYYCADNDMYYVWNEADGAWREKKFRIYWQNWDGTPLSFVNAQEEVVSYYEVPYGTMAEYRSTNPEREANVDYTYDFAGWVPALGRVTEDVTYTATYTAKQRMYTIVFQTEGGVEIERQLLPRDAFPACENEPTKAGHILKWQPALAAVTGDATYTATWLEEKPATWAITFVNYDGTMLQSGDVVAGTMPEAPATPAKPETDEYSYTFVGWTPTLEEATRDLTYTAQYAEVGKTYLIRFYGEDGALLSTQQVGYGQMPEVPACSKSNPEAGHTYTLVWDSPIEVATAAKDYHATFSSVLNKYTVTLTGEGCLFTGGGTYDYGTEVTISVVAASEGYVAKWSDGTTADKTFTVTEDVAYTATASKPDTPTACGDVSADAKAEKVLYQGTLYILRNGHIYDATGRLVK